MIISLTTRSSSSDVATCPGGQPRQPPQSSCLCSSRRGSPPTLPTKHRARLLA